MALRRVTDALEMEALAARQTRHVRPLDMLDDVVANAASAQWTARKYRSTVQDAASREPTRSGLLPRLARPGSPLDRRLGGGHGLRLAGCPLGRRTVSSGLGHRKGGVRAAL
jgi:hypothetical protein